jgi:hypothetical protein
MTWLDMKTLAETLVNQKTNGDEMKRCYYGRPVFENGLRCEGVKV